MAQRYFELIDNMDSPDRMSEMRPRPGEPRLWQAFLKKPFRLEQLLDAVARVSPGGASGGSR